MGCDPLLHSGPEAASGPQLTIQAIQQVMGRGRVGAWTQVSFRSSRAIDGLFRSTSAIKIFERDALHLAQIPGDRLRAADVLQVIHGAHRALTMPLMGWESLGYPTPPVSRPPEEVAVVVKRARAVASHQTALRLHGFTSPPWLQDDDGLIHVSRPHVRGVASRRGVMTHGRTVPAEDVEVMHGTPVTSIERTWADLAALLPVGMVDELVVAGDGIVKRP